MSSDEKKVVEYIDMTPTWSAMLPVFLAILEESKVPSHVQDVKSELSRMALAADKWVEHQKSEKIKSERLQNLRKEAEENGETWEDWMADR